MKDYQRYQRFLANYSVDDRYRSLYWNLMVAAVVYLCTSLVSNDLEIRVRFLNVEFLRNLHSWTMDPRFHSKCYVSGDNCFWRIQVSVSVNPK